ncbi:hypothetical protein C8J57DRAFT_955015, partial [Mycena rebaudengoi]
HEVYCKCQPNVPRKLEPTKDYIVKNWKSHQRTCAIVTGINPAVREACTLTTAVTLAMEGIPPKTNKLPRRSEWTAYEKGRLHQSLLVAARWIVYAGTGSVFAKGCRGVTTSLDHTCSACAAVGRLEGLKRSIRRARARAQLPPDEFTKKMAKRLAHTPLICSEHAAATVKASLATPAVMKILSSKAKHGPAGVFLSLYEQSLRGDLDDQQTFVAISGQLTEKVERSKDPSGHAIHGMRYSPMFAKYCTLMRSYGPRSGAQYDLMRGMTGAISPRQMRYAHRRAAKSATKMVSSELCPENLFPALDFAKLMNYDGPWIVAGDGTKVRMIILFSDKDSAHVVGSTFPLRNVLFKSSEEQSKITSDIDAAKAIATQVWVLAIKIPLPGMPVFPVAFIPNQGKMKGTEYRDYHLKLRELCGELGMKLLASGADGAKSEVNAQQLMMNAKTESQLSYTNEKYGVFLTCPVYPDTGPHICTTDPDHARKTARNNFLYGTHFLIVGFYFICHAILMFLLTLALVPLYIKDIFNPDKQDDGAARRLFAHKLFKFLVTSDGELRHPSLEGVFILTFHYPNIPFMPWHHGTHFLEHFFGIARSFITDFSFGQLIEMYKHILIRVRILASGQYNTKKEKDSNNGYAFDFIDAGLTAEEIAMLKDIPSRADIDRACETAWAEAAAIASQFAKMHIPTLPLKSSDIHPRFRAAAETAVEDDSDDEETLEAT